MSCPHTADRSVRRPRNSTVILGLASAFVAGLPSEPAPAASQRAPINAVGIEFEVKSDFSHIRIRKRGRVRILSFVRDGGQEVGETMLDLDKPHHLLVPYTRSLFASHLYQPNPKRVLLVGLGGGAMVHFLEHHSPEVRVDAVEIDPAIVRIADEYFGIRSEGNVQVITADGFDYLRQTKKRYDIIYMDAFLKPSAETDGTGAPLRMKTRRFLEGLRGKLTAGGVVAFNLNPHRDVRSDINTVRKAFSHVDTYRVPGSKNLIVVASTAEEKAKLSVLRQRAKELDRRFKANFSFQAFLKNRLR